MVKETLIAIATLANVSLTSLGVATPSSNIAKEQVMARQELNLTNRIPNYPDGNEIFSDNILLSLHYLKGDVQELKVKDNSRPASQQGGQAQAISGPDDIDWKKVRQPFEVDFVLKPGEIYAFHNNILPEFNPPAGGAKYTMNSRFYMDEGYKALGGLGGNGVCHLATLVNWAAEDAGLESVARVNHDFYPVPGVPREYGVSIFSVSAEQNLYIKNNFGVPVKFEFKADEKKVALSISKSS